MKELVELLKRARQEKQISLPELSEQTKIRLRLLEALEEGDVSLFAGEVYVKGAIRNYAEIVGLDPAEVMNLYYEIKGVRSPAAEAAPPPRTGERRRKYRPPNQGPSFTTGLVILCLVILALGIWYTVRHSRRETPVEPPGPNNGAGEASLGAGTGPGEPEPEKQAVLAVLDSAERETSYRVEGAGEIVIEMYFNEPCWIKLLLDGEEQFPPRTFRPGEELAYTASRLAWFRLGNPPGVSLSVNGIEIESVRQHLRPHNYSFTLE